MKKYLLGIMTKTMNIRTPASDVRNRTISVSVDAQKNTTSVKKSTKKKGFKIVHFKFVSFLSNILQIHIQQMYISSI